MSNPHPADNRISHLDMESSWGIIRIVAKDGKIRSCRLPSLSAEPRKPFKWLASRINAVSVADDRVLKKAERFARDIFGGKKMRAAAVRVAGVDSVHSSRVAGS